ncbi:hypothetical protein BST61_g3971 [Cercospora zeina]
MHFSKLLLSCLSLLHAITATPTPPANYLQDIESDDHQENHLLRRSPWPDQLYPRIRIVRYTGCRHNTTNYAHLQHRNIQIRRCITFDEQLNQARAERDNDLSALPDKPTVTKEDIDRANKPENYILSGLYWQFPAVNEKHLLMPMERCNITVYSEPNCKLNSRLVRFTNEASDVCIPAITGKSMYADCYSEEDLKYLDKHGLGATEQWKQSGILRYGPTNATGWQEQYLLPPYEKELNKTYDSHSDEWQRTCQGRKATHKGIFKERIKRCSEKGPLRDDCDWDTLGSQWLGDFPFADKC